MLFNLVRPFPYEMKNSEPQALQNADIFSEPKGYPD